MMDGLLEAFAFDIHVRRDLESIHSADGITVKSHDIQEGVVFDEGDLKVTAFLVDHRPVCPAFGDRVDCRGRSVVLSGDTRFSENLIRHAEGVDVLIHEVVDAIAQRAAGRDPVRVEAVIALHSTPDQAGEVFARVKPKLGVYSHAAARASVIEQTRKTYSGPLQGAEDLPDAGDRRASDGWPLRTVKGSPTSTWSRSSAPSCRRAARPCRTA
jgi:ribonuclease Z